MVISDNIYIISISYLYYVYIMSISCLYHIYKYHNHIYISSYPINVMLKIPLLDGFVNAHFHTEIPPKIQLCPGQIWGGSGPALILRTRRVFLHGDRGYIHPANIYGVKKLEVNGDLLRKMMIMRFMLVYIYICMYIYISYYIKLYQIISLSIWIQ